MTKSNKSIKVCLPALNSNDLAVEILKNLECWKFIFLMLSLSKKTRKQVEKVLNEKSFDQLFPSYSLEDSLKAQKLISDRILISNFCKPISLSPKEIEKCKSERVIVTELNEFNNFDLALFDKFHFSKNISLRCCQPKT